MLWHGVWAVASLFYNPQLSHFKAIVKASGEEGRRPLAQKTVFLLRK